MPTAKLLAPLSLTLRGVNYKKGEEVDVPLELARVLDEHPNFEIDMDGRARRRASLVGGLTVGSTALVDTAAKQLEQLEELAQMSGPEAIREAAGFLSVDVETNFDADGRPSLVALSAVLGRTVTEEERDAALRPARQGGAHAGAGDDAAKPKVTIVRKGKDATTEGAVAV